MPDGNTSNCIESAIAYVLQAQMPLRQLRKELLFKSEQGTARCAESLKTAIGMMDGILELLKFQRDSRSSEL